jgi:succinoglycan biosynthesis protein ExoL
LLGALITTLKQRRELRQCDVIYARNIDMMAIAAIAKWLSGSSAQLVYEVLDVQRVFVGSGMVSAIFRWCERRLLAASDMLVVSSPMFTERYFSPRQNYTGKWYLLENKVAASQVARDEQAIERMPAGPPWVIGWFGTLRCRKSLDVLSRIASQYPDLVKVDIRGTPSEEDIPKEVLVAVTSGRPNFRYHGPYQSPRDLREIYGRIHFTWAIDFLDAGSNSDWLLPNRLYEGGLFDAISIARAGTATGDKVTSDNLGVTLQEPILETLTIWLLAMNEERYDALLQSARRAPRTLFVDEDDTKRLLQALTQMKKQASAI